jgi:hypothetical protein
MGRADDATWYGDGSVLDDYKRRWSLFREPWLGEDFAKVREVSDADADGQRVG